MDIDKKRYNEILGWIINIYPSFDEATKRDAEYYFPELAESQDEKIRKELIEFVKSRGGFKQEYIAWLEIQGEHANFRNKIQIGDKVTRNEDGILVNLSQLNRVAKKQDEQKPADKVEPKFKVGQTIKKEDFNLGFTIIKIEDGFYYNDMGDHFPFTDQDNWELVEKKPAEWSEVDDNTLLDTINILRSCGRCSTDRKLWLLSLKDRVQPQPKQEWSEKDEKILSDIIKDLVHPWNEDIPDRIEEEIKWLKNKLKSLRPQSQWKPSDEQTKALEHFVRSVGESGYASPYDNNTKLLYSLLFDLKKLKS